ncbi:MAG: spore cortex-lytic enzyme [Clostridia bacterium]|nr:spore cortex-lytic enzyme [Clostridia bacterium]
MSKNEKLTKHLIKACISLSLCLIIIALSLIIYNENINEPAEMTLSSFGSRGEEVRQIQRKLKSLGFYTGSVDGIYGTATKNAVTAFQKSCGIKADGIAGPTTLLYLGLSSSSGYSSSDVWLLAKLIAGEARGENYRGQVAVGAVVLNRVTHASFPDSISGVIYQKGAFDCVTDSNWNVAPSDTAKKAATEALNGWDPTGGAIYYYNPRTATNRWIRTRPVLTTIGNHIFCA